MNRKLVNYELDKYRKRGKGTYTYCEVGCDCNIALNLLEENKKYKEENQKYKQVADKIDKKLSSFIECCKAEELESGSDFLHHSYWNMFESFNKQIKEILKEVEE